MKSLKKNLLFWGITYEKMMFALLTGLAAYVLTMSITTGNFSEDQYGTFLAFTILYLCITVFTNGYSGVVSYFPQSISMGTTRKSSFIGMQVMQHVIMLQFLLLGDVALYFLVREKFWEVMNWSGALIGGILILMALSNLLCSCYGKFGRGVATTLYIVGILMIVVVFVVVIVSATTKGEAAISTVIGFFSKPYLLVVGILTDLVTIVVYYRMIKKQDLLF